jgi:hypothetical protein
MINIKRNRKKRHMKKLLFLILLLSINVLAYSQLQTINVGTTPNDHTGDPLRTAFIKTNDNFDYHEGRLDDTITGSDYVLRKHLLINAQTGTTYTLIIGDDAKLVTMSNASANTLTVPPNSSVAFPVGTQITVCQLNTGQTTIAQGSGVTINSADGDLKLRVRYSSGTLIKTGTDTWLLIGDITT